MRRPVMVVLAGAVAWCVMLAVTDGADAGAVSAIARAVTAGVWRKAIEVPGSGALNKGGNAQPVFVSCPSAGNCGGGGAYFDGSGNLQVLVVSERNGVWGKAIEMPGSATLNKGGAAVLLSVSCASAGNCAAGGFYEGGSRHQQAFVVNERQGVWRKAIGVPGSAALNAGGAAALRSVSCPSAGNCAAAGDYYDGSLLLQAFVVSERHGVWGKAIKVPGLGALNKGGQASPSSVSCASAGNCTAGGTFTDRSSHRQVFVVSERNGVWGKAIEVPGTAALNKGREAGVTSVSCASAGNCAAGGDYKDGSHHQQAFVVSERNGVWRKAIEVPGTAALNTGGAAVVTSLSCASASNCAAVGNYIPASGDQQAFVVNER